MSAPEESSFSAMGSDRNLILLPDRIGGAAENMAVDLLLLQKLPSDGAACFRHYGWRGPSFTFGYSQKHADARKAAGPDAELCRRPSGGGVVDHTDDWTYSLVIGREHDLWKVPAPQSYRALHQALSEALAGQGVDAALQKAEDADAPAAGICFARAEPDDVILLPSKVKLAGAALKRNKHGLLFQGSVARRPLGGLDWERFREALVQSLAKTFGLDPLESGFPDWDPDQESALIDQFASEEWNRRR